MKTIMTATIIALSFAAASGASAGRIFTDPVLIDLAQDGNILLPNGRETGR